MADVLQQIPLTVTEAPPSEVIFPPLEALLKVIEDIAVVVTVGTVAAFMAKEPENVELFPAGSSEPN